MLFWATAVSPPERARASDWETWLPSVYVSEYFRLVLRPKMWLKSPIARIKGDYSLSKWVTQPTVTLPTTEGAEFALEWVSIFTPVAAPWKLPARMDHPQHRATALKPGRRRPNKIRGSAPMLLLIKIWLPNYEVNICKINNNFFASSDFCAELIHENMRSEIKMQPNVICVDLCE